MLVQMQPIGVYIWMCECFCVYLYACELASLPPHKFPWEVTEEKSLFSEQKSGLIKSRIKEQIVWEHFLKLNAFQLYIHTHCLSKACVIFLREYKGEKCWLLILSVLWATDKDIWQVYDGRICGVMRRESVENTEALLSDT